MHAEALMIDEYFPAAHGWQVPPMVLLKVPAGHGEVGGETGDDDGNLVGRGVGNDDGGEVGNVVGRGVGNDDGGEVGNVVGRGVGNVVGRGVGDCWEHPNSANSKNIGVRMIHFIRPLCEIIVLRLQLPMDFFCFYITSKAISASITLFRVP